MVDRLVISEKEKEAILALDAAGRYAYLVKRVADWEAAWGLWQGGWALVADDIGRTAFPLWPAREYAEACAFGEWADYEPEEILLHDLMEDLLLRLRKDGVFVAVFPTPSAKGMMVEPERLKESLRAECKLYE